ncbi:MAG: alanine--tRNA ligase [Candidatus Pacebacteria bacterium]|nr:alanine--tRNA ligase [Candidatus Paceibacterota bacterium]
MQSDEIRLRFLKFFESRGHKIIPSASLVPENDPSVLFNTAGMQPLVPYLLGEEHPMGSRLVNIQKCVRTQDIDEVGDKTHDTFFEMMGNWSLGDYFKEEAIKWSYEFLTSKEEGLGLDPKRLYVTVFEGDENAPKDTEAFNIWKKYIPENRIYYMSAKSNWWSVGDNGPCGPDTEMFYDITQEGLGDLSKEEYMKADGEQKVIEIWNDVFMEYEKFDGKVIGKLKQSNVDTGAGLERVVMAVQGKDDIFETDLFKPLMDLIKEKSANYDLRSARIIADHFRTAVFMIIDEVTPFNTGRGYILRRLLRRVFSKASIIKLSDNFWIELNSLISEIYDKVYPEIKNKFDHIISVIREEEKLFKKPFDGIERYRIDLEAAKLGNIKKAGDIPILKDKNTASGLFIFTLFERHGNPIELLVNTAKDLGFKVDEDEINKALKDHQEKSRSASAGMFKGGLADGGEEAKKLHTATHLLNAALKQVLGNHVMQKGSNITGERLRFDFTHSQKMTEEEKKKVEEIVNDKIAEKLPVGFVEMPKADAEKIATHSFNEKYGEMVKVYSIGDEKTGYFSREFCGGPHVSNTGELGKFKIQKEEAVAQGVRRIKATLF